MNRIESRSVVRGMRAHMLARCFGLPIAATAVTVLAAACGGSSSGGTASVDTGSGGSSSAASAVKTHSGDMGTYMTDSSGRTLYMFMKDTSSTSTCTDACAEEWPPYTQNSTQVVYKGHPMYYFDEDENAGDTKGQGLNSFGALW